MLGTTCAHSSVRLVADRGQVDSFLHGSQKVSHRRIVPTHVAHADSELECPTVVSKCGLELPAQFTCLTDEFFGPRDAQNSPKSFGFSS